MRSRFKNIIKQAKDVSLSSEEKKSIKMSLLTHMESHPLIEGSGNFNMHKRISYTDWVGNYFNNKKIMVPSALLLLLVLTGGISFASNSALPGNFLYPVKILNEKVSLAFTTDQKEKVQMLTTNANTRLQEAEELYAQGKLDQKTETDLAQSFEEDSVQANVSLEHMQKDDKDSSDKEASRFRGDLGRHRKIIGDLNGGGVSSSTLPGAIDKVIARFDQFWSPTDDSRGDNLNHNIKKPIFRQVFSRPKEVVGESRATTTVPNTASTIPAIASTTIPVVNVDDSLNLGIQYKGDPVLKKPDPVQTNTNANSNHQNNVTAPGVHIQTNTGTSIKISIPKIGL